MSLISKTKSPGNGGTPMTFATKNFSEIGQGIVVAAREAGKQTQVVTFLVDTFCLGVRKISSTTMPGAALVGKVLPALNAQYGTEPVSAGVARGIVEGAADFAKKLGFPAPAGLPSALEIFGGEPPAKSPCPFGKNGKPHYEHHAGDDEDFVESVLAKLRKACGENGFTFELPELGEDWLDGEDAPDETGEEE